MEYPEQQRHPTILAERSLPSALTVSTQVHIFRVEHPVKHNVRKTAFDSIGYLGTRARKRLK
jgi:hypothetical protein